MDILWRVFHILTEPVSLKCGQLATKYLQIYGYFYFLQCIFYGTFVLSWLNNWPEQKVIDFFMPAAYTELSLFGFLSSTGWVNWHYKGVLAVYGY